MENCSLKSDTTLYAECGIKGPKLSQIAQQSGLSGFEFMIGFPGSLGGNIFMNASAHGQSVSDNIIRVQCYSRENGIFWLNKNEMKFDYRTSRCQNENIYILGAEFDLVKKSKDEIKARMDENLAFRKSHQPNLSIPNCGSVFKNPEGNSAGKLLDEVGAKEFSVGGVKVWENHANFIVNPKKNGTSEDVLELMYKMFTSVKESYKIELRPEVRYLGNKNIREDELCKILNIK
jgi:UDP-N-acetylmuramate dehydrogenase